MYGAIRLIKCGCGGEIPKDYQFTPRVYRYPAPVYQWVCGSCGQIYEEKVKPAIELDKQKSFGEA